VILLFQEKPLPVLKRQSSSKVAGPIVAYALAATESFCRNNRTWIASSHIYANEKYLIAGTVS
jgi:hypothetical protein